MLNLSPFRIAAPPPPDSTAIGELGQTGKSDTAVESFGIYIIRTGFDSGQRNQQLSGKCKLGHQVQCY